MGRWIPAARRPYPVSSPLSRNSWNYTELQKSIIRNLLSIFGTIPATLNPPAIACHQLDALLQLAGGRGA